ncbi:MBL fold metallo-hydrolase [Halobacteriaceae archaeon GCM10025711]
MHQIQLGNTVFEGLNNVYVLGLDDDAPTTLVDTGVATPAVREELAAGLAEADVTFADVDQVVLTHWHHDHAGLAGDIQAESGADVYVHEADAPLVAHDPDAVDALAERQRTLLDAWGMPQDRQDELLSYLEFHGDLTGRGADVTPLVDGDTVAVGDRTLEAVHLPGHAAGLTGYAFDGDAGREVFIGDAILPKYTPNVGGADVRVDRPLAAYLASLERIVDEDFDRAWAGHRGVIIDPSGRAREIAFHHRERTDRVLRVVRESGPVTAWEVSAALFGALENIHVLHGPGEAYAHLDHLAHEGVLAETADGYVEGDVPAESVVLTALDPV